MTVFVIAKNTFREGIRARVLYTMVFFALILVLFSYFLGQLTLGENRKVMMDIGLSSISFFGILIAVFVGIGLVYKELEKRTIYTILSKPIHRYQFLLGKYFGLCGILLVQLLGMWAFFAIFLYLLSGSLHLYVYSAMICIYTELIVVTAVALLFSSFSTPFLSALFTVSFWLIGHSVSEFVLFARKIGVLPLIWVADLLRLIDLDHFNLINEVVHGVPFSSSRIINTVGFGIGLVILIVLASCALFRKRDFK